jgi:Antitoxin MazE-like
VHIGEHCIVVALGIDPTGAKHALGLWEGSTENAAIGQSLLADLEDPLAEARRQSLLVRRRSSEREAIQFITAVADLKGWE